MQSRPWTSLFLATGPHPIPQAPPTRGPGLAEGDGGGQRGALTSLGFHPSVRKYFSRVALGLAGLLV